MAVQPHLKIYQLFSIYTVISLLHATLMEGFIVVMTLRLEVKILAF